MIIKMAISDEIGEAWKNSDGSGGYNVVKESDWRFIDDLKYVEASTVSEGEKVSAEDFDEFYMSVFESARLCSSDQKRVLVRAKRASNGNEIAVLGDRKVFLLNDSGKTIERLN